MYVEEEDKYYDRAEYDYNISHYEGKTLKIFVRRFRGDYLLVAKASKYNNIPRTYSGLHNKLGRERLYENMMLLCKKK